MYFSLNAQMVRQIHFTSTIGQKVQIPYFLVDPVIMPLVLNILRITYVILDDYYFYFFCLLKMKTMKILISDLIFVILIGFTYWMMDEKEMYHPLPENFETGVSKLFSFKEVCILYILVMCVFTLCSICCRFISRQGGEFKAAKQI